MNSREDLLLRKCAYSYIKAVLRSVSKADLLLTHQCAIHEVRIHCSTRPHCQDGKPTQSLVIETDGIMAGGTDLRRSVERYFRQSQLLQGS